jgi:general secretion pathway protein J
MKRNAGRGVARMEALVALAIVVVVLAVLYAGYRLSLRSWDEGERTHAAVTELRLAGTFLRRYIAQATPLAINDNNVWQLWFEGKAQRLVFVTAIPAYLGPGDYYQMTLSVEERASGAALTVSRRLLHPDAKPGTSAIDDQARTLSEALDSARFSYFGADGDGEFWHSHWEGRQRLPRLVRLRLVSKRIGAWPDIVIPLPSDDNRYQRVALPGSSGQ